MRNYQSKSNIGGVADSISATRFGSGEFNSIAVELENAVESSDQTLAPSDGTGEVDNQLAMAMAIYGAGGAAFHLDTGAVNAYVLNPVSPKESPPTYFDGFSVTFVPGTANSGASTVNVASIGVKSITLLDGTALSGGEIDGNVTIRYSQSNDRFELIQYGMRPALVVFTASGNYVKPDGLKFIEVMVVGGGGGAGGIANAGVSAFGSAQSGGAGGASIKIIDAQSLAASETVTVGAGGSGGAAGNNNGASGGTTSFGAHCQATGGAAGGGNLASTTQIVSIGASGGVGSSGDINVNGGHSASSIMIGNSAAQVISGSGGQSILSSGGANRAGNNNGITATGYGGGGSGGANAGTTNNYAGGDGADGIVIIKEFF